MNIKNWDHVCGHIAIAIIMGAIIAGLINRGGNLKESERKQEYNRGRSDGIRWLSDKALNGQVKILDGENLSFSNCSNVVLSNLVIIYRPPSQSAMYFQGGSNLLIHGCYFNISDKIEFSGVQFE